MRTRMYTLACLIGLLLSASCANPQRLVDYGNFDDALEASIQRVAGKRKKKEEHVWALEEAFRRANERDLRAAERLKLEGRPEHWERIFQIYQHIQRRQSRVEPLLPLIDRSGREARIELVNVDGFLREARQRAAEYFYEQARQLLELSAREGDRQAAREAFELLRRTEKYYDRYRDREALLARARDLGTTHILVILRNQSNTLLPAHFEREVLGFNLGDLDSRWRRYHLRMEDDQAIDYRIELQLVHIELSPSLVREREYEEFCEIQDGFEYVLDERGNVRKDSLGNDIKVPRKVKVRAQVLETYQHKAARVEARFAVFDQHRNRLIDQRPLNAEAIFENRAGRFRGDERALSEDSRRLVRVPVLPFPTDAELLFDAAVHLRPELRRSFDRLPGII